MVDKRIEEELDRREYSRFEENWRSLLDQRYYPWVKKIMVSDGDD